MWWGVWFREGSGRQNSWRRFSRRENWTRAGRKSDGDRIWREADKDFALRRTSRASVSSKRQKASEASRPLLVCPVVWDWYETNNSFTTFLVLWRQREGRPTWPGLFFFFWFWSCSVIETARRNTRVVTKLASGVFHICLAPQLLSYYISMGLTLKYL